MRYVIVGNGAAGNAAAQAIRRRDPVGDITVISDETHKAYYRPLIPFLIDQERPPENLYREERHLAPDINVLLGRRVIAIDLGARHLRLDDGQSLPYDRLLLATGASPARPPVAGLDGPGVFFLRTWDDALAIREAAAHARRAAIIGGGRIGMKCAFALHHLGLRVTVVEMLDRVVPLQFDAVAGEIFNRAVQSHGIDLVLGQSAQEVVRQDGRVMGLVLADRRRLEADLIVVAVGVRPNVDLARQAGIAVQQGIVVDSYLRTSAPDVYAAGDAVEIPDLATGQKVVSGIWTNAVEMGRIAGENMAGGAAAYEGGFAVLNALELADIPVISVGLLEPPPGDGYRVFALRRGDTYRKLIFKGNILVGALLVGEIHRAGVFTGLIKRRAHLEEVIEALTEPGFSFATFLRREAIKTEAYTH